MDVRAYATAVAVCAGLAGRLPDDAFSAVCDHYAGGEPELAESTLLLSLAQQRIGITQEERRNIRSILGNPADPDLDDVPLVEEAPPLAYRFGPVGPADAPGTEKADAILSAEAARHGGRRLRRAWREPLEGARDGATWVYVLQVAEGTDTLGVRAGLSSRLWVVSKETWPLEVVVEGRLLPPYQAAALTAAREVWSA